MLSARTEQTILNLCWWRAKQSTGPKLQALHYSSSSPFREFPFPKFGLL